jgi:hypothetical protein
VPEHERTAGVRTQAQVRPRRAVGRVEV